MIRILIIGATAGRRARGLDHFGRSKFRFSLTVEVVSVKHLPQIQAGGASHMILITDNKHTYITATRGSRAIPIDFDPEMLADVNEAEDGVDAADATDSDLLDFDENC